MRLFINITLTYNWWVGWYHMHLVMMRWVHCIYICIDDSWWLWLFYKYVDDRWVLWMTWLCLCLVGTTLYYFCTINIFWVYSHPCLFCCSVIVWVFSGVALIYGVRDKLPIFHCYMSFSLWTTLLFICWWEVICQTLLFPLLNSHDYLFFYVWWNMRDILSIELKSNHLTKCWVGELWCYKYCRVSKEIWRI